MARVLVESRPHREGCHSGRLIMNYDRPGYKADPKFWYCPMPGCPGFARYEDRTDEETA